MTYIWEPLEIENKIRDALISELGQSHGETRFGFYTMARKNLLEDILEEIKRIQPNLTDHGPRHIRNVLENISDILGADIDQLNGVELYILGLCALFHDVGNVFKRSEHQKNIGTIYDSSLRGNTGANDSEQKQVVLDICKAHCGEGIDGGKNTLQFVSERAKIERIAIRPKLIAPILRFADELAEGEQRTSHFMMKLHRYSKESIQFHRYALSNAVDIDSAHGRVLVKYHITLRLPSESEDESKNNHGPVVSTRQLKKFLTFIYRRIEKLNQERQYSKHYCSLLDKFKMTSATFAFWYKQHEIPVSLSPVVCTDLVVPGDKQNSVVEWNCDYEETKILNTLTRALKDMDRGG